MKKVYDTRHGGPFDRGSADSYYNRGECPHYYEGDTGTSRRMTEEDMTEEEVEAEPAETHVMETEEVVAEDTVDQESDELWAEGQALIAESLEADLIEE